MIQNYGHVYDISLFRPVLLNPEKMVNFEPKKATADAQVCCLFCMISGIGDAMFEEIELYFACV